MTEAERTAQRTIRQVHVPSSGVSRDEPASEVGGDTHYLTLLSVSSGMVGACLTAIGLIGVMKSLNRIETFVDDLLAIGTLTFTIAAALSFLGLRTRWGKASRNLVRVLDVIFCAGLGLVVVAVLLLTWVMI